MMMPRKSLLIFLDFEATCEQNVKHYPNEIIEFPMIAAIFQDGVFLHCEEDEKMIEDGEEDRGDKEDNNNKLDGVFHAFVKPTTNGRLSEFCKTLTGIRQQQVDDSATIGVVIKRAAKWIHLLIAKHDAAMLQFCTWGNWDLGTALPNEFASKGLKLPSVFKEPYVINLRDVFVSALNHSPKGLGGALSHLGMTFEGKPHSGMDDTRNTWLLAKKLMDEHGVADILAFGGRIGGSAL